MKAFVFENTDMGFEVFPFGELVSDVEAIKANLEARLSIVQGEYMPNVMLGIPLGATKDEIDLYVRKIISETTGVVGITEFTSVLSNGKYSCRFKVDTIYGGLNYE